MDKGSFSNVTTATFRGLRRLDDQTVAWARKRAISRETLERLSVVSATVFFPDANRQLDAIAFRYEKGFKARSLVDKYFVAGEDTKTGFWGMRDVLGGPLDTVYIVEGEMDRCAAVEAGIDPACVLAAPGASGRKDTELKYVKDALAQGLSKVKKFILCTDQDDTGKLLRMQLAHILGPGRCQYITWIDSDAIKDVNDYLRSEGRAAVRNTLETGRMDWPIDGLFRMHEYPEPPSFKRWHPGVEEWGDRIYLAAGTMSVVTGQPGHGKTQLWAQLWFNIIKNYDLVGCLATFETKPRPQFQRILRQLHGRIKLSEMSLAEIKAADGWINDHYLWLVHPEQRPNLQWVLDQAEAAVTRHKAKIIQIDPWNRLETQREPGENETDYILRCLRNLYQFAVDMQVHVQILAHPSKRDYNGRNTMPVLEDIAGSKHWENLPDQGFSVWRPRLFDDNGVRQTYAELHHLKARFEDLGYPSKFGLDYSFEHARFATCQLEQSKKKKQPQQTGD